MDGINRKYRIIAEVLTPLNIGTGAENDLTIGVDCIQNDGFIRKISLSKMIEEKISPESIASCYYAISSDKRTDRLKQLIGNKIDKVTEKQWPFSGSSTNPIKSFIKTQLTGMPVIPGSSLKGAIRSILFSYMKEKGQDRETDVFGNIGENFMRLVQISDFEFEDTSLVNTKIFNLRKPGREWEGGWKHRSSNNSGQENTTREYKPVGFNTIYEVIAPGKKGAGTIMLDERGFKNYKTCSTVSRKKQEEVMSITNLFRRINGHTRNYLEKELDFFRNFNQAERSDEIIGNILTLLGMIPSDGSSCILKMSAGSGFHSITGDWQFNDYCAGTLGRGKYKGDLPKSRKIATTPDGTLSLMGFVKLSIASSDEKTEAETLREKIIQEQADRYEEDIARKKAKEEKDSARKEYDRHISQARSMADNITIGNIIGDYDSKTITYDEASARCNKLISACREAENECIEAEKLAPGSNDHIKIIEEIKAKLANIENQKHSIDLKQQEITVKEHKLQSGLAVLNETNLNGEYKVKDFKLARNKVSDWLRKSGNTVVPDSEILTLTEALKRIHEVTKERDRKKEGWEDFSGKVWQEVISWIGNEKAAAMFGQIIQ